MNNFKYRNLKLGEAKKLIEAKILSYRKETKSFDLLLNVLEQYNLTWAVVGGAPRAWLFPDEYKLNDIDIVVNIDNTKIKQIIKYLTYSFANNEVTFTKFDGIRLKSSNLDLDLWSAENTVGIKYKKINDVNLYRSVSKSAALSFDSLVYTSRGALYERGFFKTLNTGVLSLNHTDIFRPKNVASKALRLCEEFDLVPDINLEYFILQHSSKSLLESFPPAELKVSASPI